MQPDPELVAYVEREILPRYAAFDAAHRADHARTVIAQSLQLATLYPVDMNMVYAIAACHDLGLEAGRERHHLRSGEIVRADPELRRRFPAEQIETMAQAVEDHRASSDHEPRTIYGRIVAEADRCIDPLTVLRRTVQYGLEHCPDLTHEEQFARCRDHLRRKYGDGGYLRLWIPESDNARRLERLRALIRDEAELRRRFEEVCLELAQSC
ncbi:HD domain-containing protein [Alistipes sp.]|uniref:HD domain-containing protein n=1 Tax=Alistipes sp. TaxID=1872444 RepID=UPI003AF0F49D